MPPNPYEYADLLEPEMRELYLRMVREARGRIPMVELQRAMAERNVPKVLSIIEKAATSIRPETAAAWRSVVEEIFGRTAIATSSRIASILGFTFNLFNPDVMDHIEQHTAEHVLVDDATKAEIANVIRAGKIEGINPVMEAQMIRSMVGPTGPHLRSAERYKQGMIDAKVRPALLQHNYDLYVNRLVNLRAETIARTENIQAANAGRLSAWDQMMKQGILERDRARLQWRVTEDDRLCPFCAPMDGQTIWFPQDILNITQDEMFVSNQKGYPGEPDRKPKRYGTIKPDPYGQQRDELGRFTVSKAVLPRPGGPVYVAFPPLHPNCRCDVRLLLE